MSVSHKAEYRQTKRNNKTTHYNKSSIRSRIHEGQRNFHLSYVFLVLLLALFIKDKTLAISGIRTHTFKADGSTGNEIRIWMFGNVFLLINHFNTDIQKHPPNYVLCQSNTFCINYHHTSTSKRTASTLYSNKRRIRRMSANGLLPLPTRIYHMEKVRKCLSFDHYVMRSLSNSRVYTFTHIIWYLQ